MEKYYPTVEYFIKMHKIKLVDQKVHFDGKNVKISVFNAGLSNLQDIVVEIVLFANPKKIKIEKIDYYYTEDYSGSKANDVQSLLIKTYDDKKIVASTNTFIKRRSY